MNNKTALLALVIAIAALGVGLLRPQPAATVQGITKKETTFERVMRTGTIRCGYYLSPGLIMKDPNTGDMSGAMVDYVNALGNSLKFKIVWQEEINFSTYLQDLNSGKYDIECSGGWPNALRGKQVEYSTPIYYFPFYGAVRADDHRFDNNYAAINNPAVRVVGHDGGTDALIRDTRFPLSAYDGLSSANPVAADALMEIISNKADVNFLDYSTLLAFSKSNPGKIRKVDGAPVRIIPTNMSFGAGEFRLQQMINTATNELIYDGVIDRILDKYEPEPGAFLRVAAPYANPPKQ